MPNRDGLQGALPARVITLARSWRQLADRVLASLDISNSTGYALLHLERMGPGVRQSDLAREIGIAEASLVRTLQQLERSGLVAREPDPEDARAKCLHLTEQGAVLARSIDDRLRSLRDQEIRVGDHHFELAAGELIHSENSYKYSLDGFRDLAAKAGFDARAAWTDDDDLFSIHYLSVLD